MGLRRLRGRLDQLQGKANWTMDDARALIAEASEFLKQLEDGVGITAVVDAGAARTLARLLLGKGGTVPIKVVIDPGYRALPPESAKFVGGPHDGKKYRLNEEQQCRASITLKGGLVYVWDGRVFQYDGTMKVLEPKEG